MRSENGIKNRWELLEEVLEEDIRGKFDAFRWYKGLDVNVRQDNYWKGCWNDRYCFVDITPNTPRGHEIVEKARKVFTEHGWEVSDIIQRGISIEYATMTAEESEAKAKRNLLNGGRMSD